ncbi:MAG: hypothetical protein ABIJ47_02815 [Candidatus Bathyarchaeota archaeon]
MSDRPAGKDESIIVKLGTLPPNLYFWVHLAGIILMFIPLIYPLGLPVQTSQPVIDYVNTLDALPEGSVVAVSFGASASLLDEQEAQFLATWKILFSNKLKVIFYSTTEDANIILDRELGVVKPSSYGYTYGVDYVLLGYSPLGEAGEAAFVQNIRSLYPVDYYGTPLNNIPLMKDINDASGIDLVIFEYTACTSVEWVIRQWVVPFNKPALGTTLGCCGPMAAPYYPSQLKGFLSGSGAGTEIEVVSGFPGPGAAMSDSKSLGILPWLLSMVFANLAWFLRRSK